MSVKVEKWVSPTDGLRGVLSPAADVLDSAFLGAMLLSVVRGADGSIVDLLCGDLTPGALLVLGGSDEDLLGRSMKRRLSRATGSDSLRLAETVLFGTRARECAFDVDGPAWSRPVSARFAVHRNGILLTWRNAEEEVDSALRLEAAERRAATAEARLVDSFIASPDPFALFTEDDHLILCNEAWIDMFALQDVDPVIGRRFEDLMRAIGKERTDDSLSGHDVDGYVHWRSEARLSLTDDTFEMALADGRTFRMRERRTRDGGIVSLGSEVTEIIHQREVMHRALESINSRVAIFDPDGRLVVWNTAFGGLLGDDVVQAGMTFEACARINLERPDVVTLYAGEPVTLEERLALHREGRNTLHFERWYDDGSVTLMSEARTQDGWVVITGTTITELKAKEAVLRARVEELDAARAEAERHAADLAVVTQQLTIEKERAETASRTKSRFLANMSHELRTPLNAILGFSEVLMLEAFGALGVPRYREYAEDIHASGRHLLSLINDILDMAKVEAGKYTLMVEEVLLSEVVDTAVRMVRGRAAEADLHLAVARIDPGLYIRIDPRAIKQVLINLLVNAIKFTPENGFVDLDCVEEVDHVLLTVRDTGKGIDAQEIPRLLRPFEQAQAVDNLRSQGTGLGLPLSNALVDLHGGTLTVKSEPGIGTSVTIRLPRR
ncbi:MAG: ATP-binding protein [Thalassobaculaceae bacterium]|nr:ATP-binding protein [Thalassobaculaceae bacterium]